MHKRDDLIKAFREYFKNSAGKYGIEMAFLFGSYAFGYEKIESDIDIAIALHESLESDKSVVFDIISNLSYDLNKIFAKEISVLFIDREFSKPMLFYNAIIHGVPLYISNKEKYISFVLKALNEMEDFKLFGEKWQLEVIEKRIAKAT